MVVIHAKPWWWSVRRPWFSPQCKKTRQGAQKCHHRPWRTGPASTTQRAPLSAPRRPSGTTRPAVTRRGRRGASWPSAWAYFCPGAGRPSCRCHQRVQPQIPLRKYATMCQALGRGRPESRGEGCRGNLVANLLALLVGQLHRPHYPASPR
ncbi:hypothetical protein BC828DRAFT_115278 [Blastocladiella britannica]|nr:hypothetical protein BC828DRAFT_115278 [Blastocladiella britannica]